MLLPDNLWEAIEPLLPKQPPKPNGGRPRIPARAALGGHLAVLQWLRAQDPPCPWGKYTCANAAKRGHLEVLKWLRAQDPPCPWDRFTCAGAAASGYLEVLQWLRAQDKKVLWKSD